jgi:hypothetical protein
MEIVATLSLSQLAEFSAYSASYGAFNQRSHCASFVLESIKSIPPKTDPLGTNVCLTLNFTSPPSVIDLTITAFGLSPRVESKDPGLTSSLLSQVFKVGALVGTNG